jgi:hypothetical protein
VCWDLLVRFLIDESTDGRTYRDHFAPTNIPNLKGLAAG